MKARALFLGTSCLLLLLAAILIATTDRGEILLWMAGHRNTLMDYYFYYVTHLGELPGFIFIGVLFWFVSWKRMLTVPALGLLSSLVSHLLKRTFDHERPVHFLDRIKWEGPVQVLDYHVLSGHASFPSGHSMAAWALFTLAAMIFNRWWASLLCLLAAVSVSVSRVYLMAHFFQDVTAGAFLGLLMGAGMYAVYKRYLANEKAL